MRFWPRAQPWRNPWRQQQRAGEPLTLEQVLRGDNPVSDAGITITPETAMRHSAVWACVWLLSDVISMLPLHVFKEGSKQPLPLPPLLRQPSADADLADFLAMTMTSLCLRGNAYGVVTQRHGGLLLPQQIELVHPDVVQPPRVGATGEDNVYRVNGKPYEPADVWHPRAYRIPGSNVGLSPIRYAAQSIGLGLGAESFGAAFFGDRDAAGPGIPKGYLQNVARKIGPEQAAEVRSAWFQALGGRRDLPILGSDWAYKTVSIAPNESQFLETTRANVAVIARYFRVPPELVASESGNSLTYANMESRDLSFLVYGVTPWLTRLERAINPLLPKTQYCKFATGGFARAALKPRYDAYGVALGNGQTPGWLTVDEVRALEDLEPMGEAPGFGAGS